jgi:hypothetical protein
MPRHLLITNANYSQRAWIATLEDQSSERPDDPEDFHSGGDAWER